MLEPSTTINTLLSNEIFNDLDTRNRTPLILGTVIPAIVLVFSIGICIGACFMSRGRKSYRKKISTTATKNHLEEERPRYNLVRGDKARIDDQETSTENLLKTFPISQEKSSKKPMPLPSQNKSITVSTTPIYMEPNNLLDSTDSDRSYYDGVKALEDYDNYTKPGYQPMNIDAENNIDKIMTIRNEAYNMPSASIATETDPERDNLYRSYDKPFI